MCHLAFDCLLRRGGDALSPHPFVQVTFIVQGVDTFLHAYGGKCIVFQGFNLGKTTENVSPKVSVYWALKRKLKRLEGNTTYFFAFKPRATK